MKTSSYYIYKEIVPVYDPYKIMYVMIDVEKRTIIDFEGKEIYNKDIEDFPEDLKALKDLKILLPNKFLKDKITEKEFMILLNNLDGNDIYSEESLKNKKDLDKNINFERGTYILLTYLGYENLDRIDEEIFNTKALKNIDKIDKEFKNYFLIAKGFRIIDKDVNSKGELTYEDALRIVYKIINM